MPVPSSLDQHYGVPPESYWRPEYFIVNDDYLAGQIHRFELLTDRQIRGSDLTALDVGAGIGKGIIALKNAGFDAFGIEPSEPFYERARDQMAIDSSRLQLSSIELAEFSDNSFDFINMAAVVEHLYDPSQAIAKACQWLKPNGLIYVEVPSSDYLVSRLVKWFYRCTGSDYIINTCPMHAPFHTFEFTPRSFVLNGRKNGYQIAHQEYFVCASNLPGLIRPVFAGFMQASNTGMQLAVWLRKPQNVADYANSRH